jgi:hypothetical protein
MAQSDSFWATPDGQAEMVKQAMQLSKDMRNAREEEVALGAASASHQILFKLTDAEGLSVGGKFKIPSYYASIFSMHRFSQGSILPVFFFNSFTPDTVMPHAALRCIVAARGFEGKLLGCKDQTALLEVEPPNEGGEENAASSPAVAATASPEIELTQVPESVLRLALDYVYSGMVEVSDANWEDLLRVADRMKMEGLKQIVEAYMRQKAKVTSKNASEVLEIAHRHSAAGLKEYCLSLMDVDVTTVFADKKFLQLPKELVAHIIARDELVADELT